MTQDKEKLIAELVNKGLDGDMTLLMRVKIESYVARLRR